MGPQKPQPTGCAFAEWNCAGAVARRAGYATVYERGDAHTTHTGPARPTPLGDESPLVRRVAPMERGEERCCLCAHVGERAPDGRRSCPYASAGFDGCRFFR